MAEPFDPSALPVDTSPEIHDQPVSNLCSLGPRPWLISGLIQGVLTGFFADPSNIEDPTLRDLYWRLDAEGQNVGSLVIEQVSRWNPTQTAERPGIIIKRNRLTSSRIGINDANMGHFAWDGNNRYTRLLQGSTTLFCMARAAGAADRLASEVMVQLLEYGPTIRSHLHLMRFEFAEYGEIMELQEATESYAVPLTVAYAFQQNWCLNEAAPKLKRIELDQNAFEP